MDGWINNLGTDSSEETESLMKRFSVIILSGVAKKQNFHVAPSNASNDRTCNGVSRDALSCIPRKLWFMELLRDNHFLSLCYSRRGINIIGEA